KLRVEIQTRDELGQLADAFNRMSAGLAELERAKSEFLATASHELRTPLSLVLAPLESLLAGDLGPLGARQRELLQVMHNNAIRQLQLVTGLLDFTRVEAGKLELKREPLDAAALTRSIVEGFRPLARGKGLSLEFFAALTAPVVLLDRYLYERIAFNLLSNAVKFTPRDGSVRVALTQNEGRLRLSVRDTGIGISPADQASLFRKFHQLESSSTRRFEGTGLGLALVREFAVLLGGDVAVSSSPGSGSEFVVDLDAPPCAAPAPALSAPAGPSLTPRYAPAEEPAPLAPEGEGGVLIAEDNAELASYLRGLLQALGPVRVARDGEEALLLARARRPELVVADVMMPRLDGLGLCRALKANPLTAAIPVLLLTALTDRDSLARGWTAGADEYLFKPFHPKELLTRVRTLLAAARARRRAEEVLAAKHAELEAANREVVKANEELKSFNYSVTHDLRAPLHSLDAFCVLLERALPANAGDDARAFIKHIHSGVARMDAIIIGMLQLSRVMSREFAAGETDLSAAVASIGEELARAQPGRAVELAVEPGVTARADATLARVVLQNLLENAWKFTAGRSPAKVEFGRVRLDGEEAYFVRDDGAGFDMAYAQGLFTPFHRLHSAKDFPGTGIGLATVRRVVERHGGRVWAEAAPGKGATVYFTLAPRAGAAGPPAAGGSSPARAAADSAG
ncbi:MAG: ATP-binding protein, partial [Elusimicrobia bacterium]|nr:ATP-binding protein [Elusimicrobiota bacterium]